MFYFCQEGDTAAVMFTNLRECSKFVVIICHIRYDVDDMT